MLSLYIDTTSLSKSSSAAEQVALTGWVVYFVSLNISDILFRRRHRISYNYLTNYSEFFAVQLTNSIKMPQVTELEKGAPIVHDGSDNSDSDSDDDVPETEDATVTGQSQVSDDYFIEFPLSNQ